MIGTAILERQDLLLDLGDALVELGLLALAGLELQADAAGDGGDLLGDGLVDVRDLPLDLLHLGVAGLIDLQVLLVLGLQFGAAPLQLLDGLAVEHTRDPRVVGIGQAQVGRLGLDAGGLGLDQGSGHFLEPGHEGRKPIFRIDDLALAGILHQALLGVFQGHARLLQLFLKEAGGVGGGLEATLQIHINEIIGDGVGHRRSFGGTGALVGNFHQPGVTHRLDVQIGKEGLFLGPWWW